MTFKEYITSFFSGLRSLLVGMGTTIKVFFRRKTTEQYPENRATLKISDRFRGELVMIHNDKNEHRCVACGICQMNCPNGTIKLTTKMVDMPDGKKKRKLDKYMYDLGSCTFCMLCVTTCPQHALEFSNDFEQAVFQRDSLVKQLNYLPEKELAPAPKPQVDPAVIAAAKEKAARIKAEREAAAKAQAEVSQTKTENNQ